MIFLATLLTVGIVVLSVSVHYEALRYLSRLLRTKRRWYSHRIRACLVVLGCLLVHFVEVIFFGLGFELLEFLNEGTDLKGSDAAGLTDIYYSSVVYTSIGFGGRGSRDPPSANPDGCRRVDGCYFDRVDGLVHVFPHATFLGRRIG